MDEPPKSTRGGGRVTPVMRQFAEAKAQYPDAIVFFRLGDFYEMFFDDAVLASKILGITLTSRNKESPDSEPMAGVPHHAAHGYIAKLLRAGHKVAICEQLADPSKVKGIVPRAVVRVVTPGLVTDDDQLDARENHFLAAVDSDGHGGFGIALLDLSTGELLATSVPDVAFLFGELVRASPREILFGRGTDDAKLGVEPLLPGVAARWDETTEADPDAVIARVLGEDAATDARANHAPASRAAASRALAFAARCSPRADLPVRRLGMLDVSHAMHVDETAQAHLEIARGADGSRAGTLLETIDRTVTAGGARLLKRRLLAPLYDVGAIRARLDQVELFVIHARARAELREGLGKMPDLERIAVKIALGQAGPRDLGRLRDGLESLPRIRAALVTLPESERKLARLGASFLVEDQLVARLASHLTAALVERPAVSDREPGFIRDGFDRELDEARTTGRSGTELVVALETRLREQTGAQGIRVRYNSVFGWYIEVTKSHLAKVPKAWRRKQTVATGERFTTDELDQLAADIESAEDRAREREALLWGALCEEARGAEPRLRELARALAEIDVASALAEVAHQNDYTRPEVDASDVIDIEDGRHPVVEQHAEKGRFVPNDTALDLEAGRLYLVTGPNMAGKSTLMRQVALVVLLAQAGSYVPAKRARIGVVDRLLSRVGASDNLARGESTFMVEMRETASILRTATRRSLVILDEIGRGTSTYDGLAIAWAVAEHLHDKIGCRALFATHYHELTQLAKTAPHLVNVSVSAREHDGGVIFLHRLTKGPASRSYGIAVAKLAGLPESVLGRASTLLEGFEGEGSASASATKGPEARPGAEQKSAKLRGKRGVDQLGLFAPSASDAEAHPVLAELAALDVERTTPLEALALLARLKRRL